MTSVVLVDWISYSVGLACSCLLRAWAARGTALAMCWRQCPIGDGLYSLPEAAEEPRVAQTVCPLSSCCFGSARAPCPAGMFAGRIHGCSVSAFVPACRRRCSTWTADSILGGHSPSQRGT